MKKTFTLPFALMGACTAFFHLSFAGNENPVSPQVNRCGTDEYNAQLLKKDPSSAARMAEIEAQYQQFLKNPPPTTKAVIYIPIVFHIVWNTSAENVSDNCILTQFGVLNKDFRKLNTDAVNIPSSFQSIAADCEIEFCLASKDPTGNPTNGITRTQTSSTSFSTNDNVKFNSTGGKDIWDRNKYLNIWVCDLGSGLLGYAQFPGQSASTDGVVIDYQYMVSSAGCGTAPYNLGRTSTHEIGHWLNLRHIWGDANCGNDQVSDTPTAEGPHYSVNGSGPPTGCPTHPYHTNQCGAGTSPNGENWQNYMDYTDDKCMFMFTAGQKTRMVSTLNGTRSSLLTSAATNCSAVGVNNISISDYISLYPNPSAGVIYMSVGLPNVSSVDVTIFDVLGKAVLTRKINVPSQEVELNLEDNPDGIYLIEVNTPLGKITQKVVLNR